MNTQEINTDALDLALAFVGGQINEPNLPKIVGGLYQTISAALERGYAAGAYAASDAASDAASTCNTQDWDAGYVAGVQDARAFPDVADDMLADITEDYIGSIQQAAEAFETELAD